MIHIVPASQLTRMRKKYIRYFQKGFVNPVVVKDIFNSYFNMFRPISQHSCFVSFTRRYTTAINKIKIKTKLSKRPRRICGCCKILLGTQQRSKMMIYVVKLRIYMWLRFIAMSNIIFLMGRSELDIFSRCELLRRRQNCHRDFEIINENIVKFIRLCLDSWSELLQKVFIRRVLWVLLEWIIILYTISFILRVLSDRFTPWLFHTTCATAFPVFGTALGVFQTNFLFTISSFLYMEWCIINST